MPIYNDYLNEILRGQEQQRVLGKQGLSSKETSAAFKGAMEAAYNAEASNRDYLLRKSAIDNQNKSISTQEKQARAASIGNIIRSGISVGEFALNNSDKLSSAYNWVTGTSSPAVSETSLASGSGSFNTAGTLGSAYGSGSAAGASSAAGEGAFNASGMIGPAYGSGSAAGASSAAGEGAFNASGMLGPAYGSGSVAEAGAGTGATVGAGSGASTGSTVGMGATIGGYFPVVAGAAFAGSKFGEQIGSMSPVGGAKEKGAMGGAVAGAAAGAMIGSIIPVVGTIVGAVIGGIVGAISGLIEGGK
jgi:hypothetical protein